MPFIGELSALGTAVCWTGSSIAFAAATMRVGSVYVNVTRLIAAAVILLLIVLAFGIPVNVSTTQAAYLFVSGLVGLVFGDTFLFKSYEYNGARISSLIMSTAPAVTALLGYFFLGETLSFLGIFGMAVTLGGIALVVLERQDHSSSAMPLTSIGMFYAFLGAVGQAGGLVLAKGAFVEGPIDGFVATLIRMLAAVSVIVPLTVAARRYSAPVAVFSRDRTALLGTLTGTVFGPVLGVTGSLIAIAHTKTAIAATLMATVPIIMLPAARYVQKETLSWRAIAGAVITVAGVVILFLR